MLRILRGVGWALLGLVVLVLLLWSLSRLWPLPAAQREQVRWLEDVQPAPGKNGFALLWTLPFDGLDPAQREAALAVDVRRWQAGPAPGMADSALAATHPAVALDPRGKCGPAAGDCLAKVRADEQGFSAAHAGHLQLHARLDSLADVDNVDTPFVPSGTAWLMPLPNYALLMDGTGAHALAYVQGDIAGALAGSCRSVQMGRRLMRGGNTLIDSMIGAAVVRTHVQLLAAMLAELPPDQVLPAACERALQPMDADGQSLCRAMQGEFAISKAAIDASLQQAGTVLMLDREHTLGRIALNLGWACDPATTGRLAADMPVVVGSVGRWDVGCLSNMIGCVLGDIAAPAYQDYAARSQDAAAWLRLLGTQRWLRQQADAPEQALHRLPAHWRSPSRTPVLSADGKHLQVPRRARDMPAGAAPLLSVPL
ncbi:hypothetical protein [Stenotrophomonas sp. PFBMAA-4]|uniref:hypothetical protein n=1 Tax=Stenotrophomonas sp. PFBMAA-4 TaxID=3043301 RepID=UPI0024B61EDF|nr:hypothetical protein [Stenotrophomonas sp. PFBMAA-4]MDI9274829.1 hypothetical protein [Stenotrophomonas sp. PFBMAA-4]